MFPVSFTWEAGGRKHFPLTQQFGHAAPINGNDGCTVKTCVYLIEDLPHGVIISQRFFLLAAITAWSENWRKLPPPHKMNSSSFTKSTLHIKYLVTGNERGKERGVWFTERTARTSFLLVQAPYCSYLRRDDSCLSFQIGLENGCWILAKRSLMVWRVSLG